MNWANRLTLSRLALTILFVAALSSPWRYAHTTALITFLSHLAGDCGMEPEHHGERLVAARLERSGGRPGMVNCRADPLLWPWLCLATPHCHRGGSLIETRSDG